jgi:hypothetical protein
MMEMLNALKSTGRRNRGHVSSWLRPGEARGAKWTNHNEGKRSIRVQRSIWRKHETGPKTEGSVAPVHVPEVLAAIV